MSRRLIAVVTPDVANGREARVYRDDTWDEYRVRLVVDGRVVPAADYFTDHTTDAMATAETMARGPRPACAALQRALARTFGATFNKGQA